MPHKDVKLRHLGKHIESALAQYQTDKSVWRDILTRLSLSKLKLYSHFVVSEFAVPAILLLCGNSDRWELYKKRPFQVSYYIIRHRASFPHSSIIAAAGLNFCVRNGNRCFPSAMDTESASLSEAQLLEDGYWKMA